MYICIQLALEDRQQTILGQKSTLINVEKGLTLRNVEMEMWKAKMWNAKMEYLILMLKSILTVPIRETADRDRAKDRDRERSQ